MHKVAKPVREFLQGLFLASPWGVVTNEISEGDPSSGGSDPILGWIYKGNRWAEKESGAEGLGTGYCWQRNVPHPRCTAGTRPAPTGGIRGACRDFQSRKAKLGVLLLLGDSGSHPRPGRECLLQRPQYLLVEPGMSPGSWIGTQDTLKGLSLARSYPPTGAPGSSHHFAHQ